MAPAAIITRRPVRRSSPTASVVGPTKRARPWNCSTPICAHACSVRCEVGSTSDRLKRMSAGQSIVSEAAGTPTSAMSRAPWTASAAPTRIFLGTQPRSAQVPPNGRESTTATVQPASRHLEATAEVTPVPTTTRSNRRSIPASFPGTHTHMLLELSGGYGRSAASGNECRGWSVASGLRPGRGRRLTQR